MNEFNLQTTSGTTPRFQRWVPALSGAGLPSFARALRQRGLMAAPEAGSDESWTPVFSVFEAHLRRLAMEQAFASMRGELA